MEDRVLVVTNRTLQNPRSSRVDMFGESLHAPDMPNVRLAHARMTPGGWSLNLVPEPDQINQHNSPSHAVFRSFSNALIRENRHCIFYIHGFKTSFEGSLNQAYQIAKLYNVGVVLFSWPSLTTARFIINDYRQAQQNARATVNALVRTLVKLSGYMQPFACRECGVTLNLLVHSLGNQLLQMATETPEVRSLGRIFANMILHQADIDADNHAEWIEDMTLSSRTYVTLNRKDSALSWSKVINPRRLGHARVRINDGSRTRYVDFASHPGVGKDHDLVVESSKRLPMIRDFFDDLFSGKRGERRLLTTQTAGCYHVPEEPVELRI